MSPSVSERSSLLMFALVATSNSSLPIIRELHAVDYFDTLTQSDHVAVLPPLFASWHLTAALALVFSINEATETGALASNNNHDLSDPALDGLDVGAALAGQRIHDVNCVGCQVLQHMSVSGWSVEGHDVGGLLDHACGLL